MSSHAAEGQRLAGLDPSGMPANRPAASQPACLSAPC